LTTAIGIPAADDQNSFTAVLRGPVLMQEGHLLGRPAHFDRERIPVHSATVNKSENDRRQLYA